MCIRDSGPVFESMDSGNNWVSTALNDAAVVVFMSGTAYAIVNKTHTLWRRIGLGLWEPINTSVPTLTTYSTFAAWPVQALLLLTAGNLAYTLDPVPTNPVW